MNSLRKAVIFAAIFQIGLVFSVFGQDDFSVPDKEFADPNRVVIYRSWDGDRWLIDGFTFGRSSRPRKLQIRDPKGILLLDDVVVYKNQLFVRFNGIPNVQVLIGNLINKFTPHTMAALDQPVSTDGTAGWSIQYKIKDLRIVRENFRQIGENAIQEFSILLPDLIEKIVPDLEGMEIPRIVRRGETDYGILGPYPYGLTFDQIVARTLQDDFNQIRFERLILDQLYDTPFQIRDPNGIVQVESFRLVGRTIFMKIKGDDRMIPLASLGNKTRFGTWNVQFEIRGLQIVTEFNRNHLEYSILLPHPTETIAVSESVRSGCKSTASDIARKK